jgi:hypothetical protein
MKRVMEGCGDNVMGKGLVGFRIICGYDDPFYRPSPSRLDDARWPSLPPQRHHLVLDTGPSCPSTHHRPALWQRVWRPVYPRVSDIHNEYDLETCSDAATLLGPDELALILLGLEDLGFTLHLCQFLVWWPGGIQ